MSALFSTERSVITKHISNILQTKELVAQGNVQKMHTLPRTTRPTGLPSTVWTCSSPSVTLTLDAALGIADMQLVIGNAFHSVIERQAGDLLAGTPDQRRRPCHEMQQAIAGFLDHNGCRPSVHKARTR